MIGVATTHAITIRSAITTMRTTSMMIFDISYALLKYSRYGILEIQGLGYVSEAM
jgi:hypothetical protein